MRTLRPLLLSLAAVLAGGCVIRARSSAAYVPPPREAIVVSAEAGGTAGSGAGATGSVVVGSAGGWDSTGATGGGGAVAAGGRYVLVGYDEASDGYHGDTPTHVALPVLCLRESGLGDPGGVAPHRTPGGSLRGSWSGAEVALTEPITGRSLTGRGVADDLCATRFGPGWRMAEFHDGGPGAAYDFWAHASSGDFAASRFWVSISDQRANPWDSDRAMTWRLLAYR